MDFAKLFWKDIPVSVLWRNSIMVLLLSLLSLFSLLLLLLLLLPQRMQDGVSGPELWLLTAEKWPRPSDRNHAPGFDFFSFWRFPPTSFTVCFASWQHDGTQSCTFGIITIMVRFKCPFPRSCSWGFIQSRTGFFKRDGYKWVRSTETFCCWDFGWVLLSFLFLNYRTRVVDWNLALQYPPPSPMLSVCGHYCQKCHSITLKTTTHVSAGFPTIVRHHATLLVRP